MFQWFKRKENKKDLLRQQRNNLIKSVIENYPDEIKCGINTIILDFKNAKSYSEYTLSENVEEDDKEIIIQTIRKKLQKDYGFPYPRYISKDCIYYNFGNQGMCDFIITKN